MTDLQHGLKCLDCGDELYSNSRHDFQACTCMKNNVEGKGVFVDGGTTYMRIGKGKDSNVESISRPRPKEAAPYGE